jgi:hypothetical protein
MAGYRELEPRHLSDKEMANCGNIMAFEFIDNGDMIYQLSVRDLRLALIAYMRVFSQKRWSSAKQIPDGSPLLDSLAYGFSALTEVLLQREDLMLSPKQQSVLENFDARLKQVAYTSKHWTSDQEWESVEIFAWKMIETWELDTKEPPIDELN